MRACERVVVRACERVSVRACERAVGVLCARAKRLALSASLALARPPPRSLSLARAQTRAHACNRRPPRAEQHLVEALVPEESAREKRARRDHSEERSGGALRRRAAVGCGIARMCVHATRCAGACMRVDVKVHASSSLCMRVQARGIDGRVGALEIRSAGVSQTSLHKLASVDLRTNKIQELTK
eukprot:2935121-Pleurochrysis_carterae.AAC.1